MKIGVNLWIWESPFQTSRHLSLLSKARALGAETVEFALEDDAELNVNMLQKALRSEGLECSTLGMFGPQRDLSSPEAAVRRSGIEYAKKSLDTVAALEATIFSGAVLGVGSAEVLTPSDRNSSLKRAAACLNELGGAFAQARVRFCVEVLNRYETNLVNTAQEALELVRLSDHPNVGIHLDTFHMNIEETSLDEAIRAVGSRLFHLHGSDSHRGAPGDGHIRWSEVFSALGGIQYSDAVVFESFNPAGRLAPLARFWRSFSESPDMIAAKGLATLSEMRVQMTAHQGA